jgi:hypothetical protein
MYPTYANLRTRIDNRLTNARSSGSVASTRMRKLLRRSSARLGLPGGTLRSTTYQIALAPGPGTQ